MQITELAAKLKSVGLSDKQAKVYVAALFLGPSAVQKIAEQAEINRATTYVILDELTKMGLVSESTEAKKTVFVAEPPEAIDRYLDHQAKQIGEKKSELQDLLPSLKEMSRSADTHSAPVVRFYSDIEASCSVTDNFYRKAKPNTMVYSLTNMDVATSMYPNILHASTQKRLSKNISNKLLYSYSNSEIKSDRKNLLETKKVKLDLPSNITIYDSGIVMETATGKKPNGVVIESQELADTLRQLFELAWRSGDI